MPMRNHRKKTLICQEARLERECAYDGCNKTCPPKGMAAHVRSRHPEVEYVYCDRS